MQETHIVTCFLEHDNRILILQRSDQVGTYTQRWAGISGYIEHGISPLDQAYQEIIEEAGLERGQLELIKIGESVEVPDEKLHKKWIVHPFRFRISDPGLVKIDWEHNEARWIKPDEIKEYQTVPGLYAAWELVR